MYRKPVQNKSHIGADQVVGGRNAVVRGGDVVEEATVFVVRDDQQCVVPVAEA